LLAAFQSLDFMTMQGITGAAVFKKLHNMCNGANLAYERTAFDAVNGFKDIDNIASGDDMLLMHKIYQQNPNKVLYLKSPEAIVSTQPSGSWKEFLHQRIRWASKADQYKDKRIFWVLFMVYLFNFLLIAFPILLIFADANGDWWKYWLGTALIKTAVETYFLYKVAGFFQQRSLLLWFPFLQPLHWLYIVLAGWLGKFGSYQWKERKVK
jgi:cellulose synthase/poly-beta-1,6-N-acetylglucosamine synthase-like glycosyltransferase